MKACACGCGQWVRDNRHTFIHGHNGRLQERRECSVITCHALAHAGGMCGRHNMRFKKYGELYPVTSKSNPKLWFWAHVAIPATDDGCWFWLGEVYPTGYGCTVAIRYSPTRTPLAHRWAYEQRVGPIPEGMHLDHLCRNRSCVNPEHLEPVTPKENTRRGLHGVLRTHCARGHELTEENTYLRVKLNGRRCRTCATEDMRAKRAAAKEAS